MRRYQLTLQFPGRAAEDYERIETLEAALTASLGPEAEVDGHDVGSEAIHLFIDCDDPLATFEHMKPLLDRHEQLDWVTAACRITDSDRYEVIWPKDSRKAFKID